MCNAIVDWLIATLYVHTYVKPADILNKALEKTHFDKLIHKLDIFIRMLQLEGRCLSLSSYNPISLS